MKRLPIVRTRARSAGGAPALASTLLAAALCALLPACTSLAPQYERPELSLPAAFVPADPATGGTDSSTTATANATGTPAAYRPAGALERGGARAPATGDYEAWQPEG